MVFFLLVTPKKKREVGETVTEQNPKRQKTIWHLKLEIKVPRSFNVKFVLEIGILSTFAGWGIKKLGFCHGSGRKRQHTKNISKVLVLEVSTIHSMNG